MYYRSKILLWGQSRIEKGASVLAPLSWLWGFFVFLKNRAYARGICVPKKVSCPVISVGNIVAGGTGKTPLVLLLAQHLPLRRIAILSRGYGQFPDEPKLLQKKLPHAKVYVGKDRVRLAQKAVLEGAEVMIMDDGFQYRKLHRDIDLVLLFGEDPFGKGHYLPRGFLRDDPRRLQEADAIFVNGKEKGGLSFPYISLELRVQRVVLHGLNQEIQIKGKKVAIFCGIARPKMFRKTVESLGAEVVLEWYLPDHGQILEKNLQDFCARAECLMAQFVLCTEKDAIKLDPCSFPNLGVVEIALEVAQGKDLWENLIAKINRTIDTERLSAK